ncbi:hypothetical protein [Chitinophaga vietnamensis]|uniref:hypothetical protein n=1 Tax=Chitinophaga vietnamensis TaxID=2593957 RepID=UPI0011780D81|nr:hypothetical protein [Chitinophaga vietnamensis]
MARKASNKNLLEEAHQAEADGNLKAAVTLYRRALRIDPLTVAAYNRLMIIYRKQKDYIKELDIIDEAIHALQSHEQQQQKDWIRQNRKAASISRQLAQSLGQSWEDPVVSGWKKRAELVRTRI